MVVAAMSGAGVASGVASGGEHTARHAEDADDAVLVASNSEPTTVAVTQDGESHGEAGHEQQRRPHRGAARVHGIELRHG